MSSAVPADLEVRLARYRTALVALLDMLARQSRTYRSWEDQQLVRAVVSLLDEEETVTESR
jgi:hypothetical protein